MLCCRTNDAVVSDPSSLEKPIVLQDKEESAPDQKPSDSPAVEPSTEDASAAVAKEDQREENKEGPVVTETVTLTTTATDGEYTEEEMAAMEEMKAEIAALKQQVEVLELSNRRGGCGMPKDDCDGDAVCKGLICKVNHFAIIVSDAEKSKDFYVGIMGAKIANRPNFPAPGYWLWLGNIQLHLIEGKHAGIEASHAKGVATGHVNHLSLEVHDFDETEKRLKANNVKYTKNLVPEGDDVIHQLFIPDPDGHYIEICDCNKFDEFVHGAALDPEEAQRLAGHYLEGADLLGTTVAAACAISFVPGLHHGTEDDFHSNVGNLHRAFKLISGGENTIDATHWHKFLKRMGHEATEDDVKRSLLSADEDGNGTLDFHEFCELMLHRMKPMTSEEQLHRAFSMMDRNHDGTIDKDEMLLMLWGMGQRMDETELANAIAAADKDGDGKINEEEFLNFVKKQTEEEIHNIEEEEKIAHGDVVEAAA